MSQDAMKEAMKRNEEIPTNNCVEMTTGIMTENIGQ